ncbi:MAG: phospholipid carrier-dependent glycosyltransferase [Thermodesulfobacteriota bacterium]|nr:phospholipid carrier-dependent glycosyltransferase [Thermodesulfobacteriota bacterium]
MNDTYVPKVMPLKTVFTISTLLFFLIAYILPLGVRHLVVPDETRYAEIPREMMASGDFIVPRLNGLRYFEKPVLGYWVNAGSMLLLGENNFAVRLPSALAVGLSALLIYMLIGRISRRGDDDDDYTAVLAALIFLSCFEVFGVGNTVVLDSLFSFFLTACIGAFYLATEEQPGSFQEKGFLLSAGLACGLAFLTKGFLALAVPVLALVPYLVWQRRYIDLLRMGWLPILFAAAVALPWSILIYLREPDFWQFFFWNEHIRRFMADNAQHKESFWFFFLRAPAMFIPWAFVALAAIPAIRPRLFEPGPQNRLLRFCVCWLVLPFVFFSLSSGKLLTYILPCFPPFAILTAFGLSHVLKRKSGSILFQAGVVVSAVLLGLVLVALLYVQAFGFDGFRPYSQPWKVVMLVNGLVFFVLFCFWSFRSRTAQTKIFFLGLAPLLLFFVAHYTIPDLTTEVKSPGPILEEYAADISSDDIVIADEDSVRAVCWYLRRSDIYVLGDAGELNYGFGYEDAKDRLLDVEAAAEIIKQHPGKIVLFARVRSVSQWWDQLPQPVFQDQNGPFGYVFRRY